MLLTKICLLNITGACDFETDFCSWTTLGTGAFTWSRGGNQTATANTGPAFDHTIGNSRGRYCPGYMATTS